MSSSSVTLIVGLSILLIFYLAFTLVLYPAIFSPLRKVPSAHFLAPWTSLWILYKRLTKGENELVLMAHRQYGSVVRVGPNEVSINDPEGLKAIYTGNLDKYKWFANAGMVNGISNAFSSLDRKSHAESRRLFSHVYSNSFIQNSSEVKVIFGEMMSNRIASMIRKAAIKNESVDVLSLSGAIGHDLTTAYVFGIKGASDTIRDLDARHTILREHDVIRPYFNILGELLSLIQKLESIGLKPVPIPVYNAFGSSVNYIAEMCKAAGTCHSSTAIVYDYAVKAFDKKQLTGPKEARMVAELFDQTVAGFETIVIAITYLIYEMSRNMELQTMLREELQTAWSINSDLIEPSKIDSLPLLDAVIRETLRLYPPVPMTLPRVAPKGGIEICGYHIPGDARVGSNAYTLHQNESVFPAPRSWKPERWLTSDEVQIKEMKRWFWAFGSGARMCLGIHYAMLVLKYTAATVYQDFETSIVDMGDMTQMDGFLGRPAGDKLLVRFTKVTR